MTQQLVVELSNSPGGELRPRMRRPFKMSENAGCFQMHFCLKLPSGYPGTQDGFGTALSQMPIWEIGDRTSSHYIQAFQTNLRERREKLRQVSQNCHFFFKAWCPRRGGWGRGRGQGGESLHPQRLAEELMSWVTCAQLIHCLPQADIKTRVFADILEGRVNSATMAEISVNIPWELLQGAAFPSES